MALKTAAAASAEWVRKCERNERFMNGTATPEDHAEITEWLADGGFERSTSAIMHAHSLAAREQED